MIKEIEITIPFYDVDSMRVVYHGNYVKYFEDARCAYLLDKGMSYNDMEKMGYLFPVVEMKAKYIKPCVFGQEIIVACELVNCENFLTFRYEIRDKKTSVRICKAETKQMCVDIKTMGAFYVMPMDVVEKLKD